MMNKGRDFIADLIAARVPWLSGDAPADEVVLGVRLELSRNFITCPFPVASDTSQRLALREQVKKQLRAELLGSGFFLSGESLNNAFDCLLEERWLLDRDSRRNRLSMGFWLNRSHDLALVVNQEEHLRLRSYGNGSNLINPLRQAEAAAASLERDFPLAFCPQRGYLTSDPTRLGSGLQVSIILHLPGLVFARQMESLIRAAQELQIEIRGAFNQGTEVNGHFFQFTWRACGRREAMRTVIDVGSQVRQLKRSELSARKRLYNRQREWLRDYVGRAYGVLRHGGLLQENEMLGFLSALRLGCGLGFFSRLRLLDLTELPVRLRRGHLAYSEGGEEEHCRGTMAWRRSDFFRRLLEQTELSASK